MTQTGQAAARNARLAQGAAVVLLGAVGVLGAVGIPGMTPPKAPGELQVKETEVKIPPSPNATARGVDYASLSGRLSLLENAPKPVEVSDSGGGEEASAPPPPPPPAPVMKYLGPARVGSLTLALMSDNGKQRFVKAGDHLSDESVVKRVMSDGVEVEKGGVQSKIDLSERLGALTTSGVQSAGKPTAGKGWTPPTSHLVRPRGAEQGISGELGRSLSGPEIDKFLHGGYEKDGHFFDPDGNAVTDARLIQLFQYRTKVANSDQFKDPKQIDDYARKLLEKEQAVQAQGSKGQK